MGGRVGGGVGSEDRVRHDGSPTYPNHGEYSPNTILVEVVDEDIDGGDGRGYNHGAKKEKKRGYDHHIST